MMKVPFRNTKKILTDLYNEDYYKVMTLEYLRETRLTKLRMSQVTKMVSPRPRDKILDLGCATGNTAHFCSEFGADVTGIDISLLAIEKARQLYRDNKNLDFLICNVVDLSIFEDEYFDKAVAMDLVEHICQDAFGRMVRETYRVLKAGGTLSIYTPCKTHLIERLKAKNFILKQDPKHVSVKSMSEIVSTLESCGFKTDMAYFTTSFFPIFQWIELLMQPIPLWGDLFKYRICVRGVKV